MSILTPEYLDRFAFRNELADAELERMVEWAFDQPKGTEAERLALRMMKAHALKILEARGVDMLDVSNTDLYAASRRFRPRYPILTTTPFSLFGGSFWRLI